MWSTLCQLKISACLKLIVNGVKPRKEEGRFEKKIHFNRVSQEYPSDDKSCFLCRTFVLKAVELC